MVSRFASWLLRITPLFLFVISFNSLSSELVPGDDTTSTTDSFTFAVGPSTFFRNSNVEGTSFAVTIGAGAAVAGNNFAVAYMQRGGNEFTPTHEGFMPLAPPDSVLNGAKINHLALFGMFPLVVQEGVKRMYVYSKIDHIAKTNGQQVWSSKPQVTILPTDIVNDKNAAVTGGIIGLSDSIALLYIESGKEKVDNFVLAPVLNTAGDAFGTAGSGMALGVITSKVVKVKDEDGNVIKDDDGVEKKQSITTFDLANANPANTTATANVASPFDISLDALKITADLDSIGDVVDIHVDPLLSRIYIAVQATSGVGGGARSIVVARVGDDKKLIFEKIVPDAAIVGNDKIVGTASASQAITGFKVRTMQTSTMLDYLIVSGGNGDIDTVGNQVYALPLVNLKPQAKNNSEWRTSSVQGTIAKFDQTPQLKVSGRIKNFVKAKVMQTPATVAADLLTNTSVAAMVGAGELPMDPSTQSITDMFVQNDSVFVSIGGDYDGGVTQPGLFESQAIFDDLGRVVSWTPWRRVAGTDDKIFAASLDTHGQSSTGGVGANFWLISGATDATKRTVRRTIWGNGSNDGLLGGTATDTTLGLTNYLNTRFSQEMGGVQVLNEFIDMSADALGLGFDQFGLIVAGGHQRVALVQTGQGDGGNFIPTKGDFVSGVATSSDGTLPTASAATKIIDVEKGALTDIGVISTCAIVTNSMLGEHWLVVGGPGGVAVLCDATGSGWTTDLTGLDSFPAGMSFKKLGSFPNVRKIIGTNSEMYVLTLNKMERMVLTPASILSDSVSTTTLGDPESVTGSRVAMFMDMAVSSGAVSLGLLATTKGLYRIGNGENVFGSTTPLSWVEVALPEGAGPTAQFSLLSPSELSTGFGTNGQVYVLGSYQGYYYSRIYRMNVNVDGAIDSDTVQLLDDQRIENSVIYFVDCGDFRNSFVPDGGLFFHSRSQDIRSADPELESGVTTIPLSLFSMPTNSLLFTGVLPATKSTNIGLSPGRGTTVNKIIRNSALGGWLVPGDYGVRVSE
ncbi:MAG TPA: hypothetical protein QGF02_01265 [Candidatus Babeliales bacterium]|nr:hypothetical protein [Candidatus Babeliales bacterium]